METTENKLGRFEIIDRLGAGGMGTVYRAYDPRLDRRIAVKVLGVDADALVPGSTVRLQEISPELAAARFASIQSAPRTKVLPHRQSTPAAATADLLAEARAMAQLSHPNVVSVYEIGSSDEQLFIAMELVEGRNLRQWLAETTPPRADVLTVFHQAAQGLAAAHRVGLIHRDFKPDNVLVSEAGSVQVADFGLAMSPEVMAGGTPELGTRVAGTPKYMAPELRDGGAPSAGSDVYAFCVALVEALSGVCPDLEAIGKDDRAIAGLVATLGRVPRAVAAGLRAGLSFDPEKRPRNADAMVAMLAPRRRRWVPAVAVAIVASAGVASALTAFRPATASCDAEWDRLSASWNPTRAALVDEKIRSLNTPLALDTAPRAVSILGERAQRMQTIRRDVCLARERKEISPELSAARNQCLEKALVRFEAIVDALAFRLKVSELPRIAAAAAAGGNATACATIEVETGRVLVNDAAAARRSEFAALKAAYLLRPEDLANHRAVLADLLKRSDEEDDSQLSAEVSYLLGRAELMAGDNAAAKKTFRIAIARASSASNDRLVAAASIKLASTVANRLKELVEGETLIDLAEAALTRVPDAHDLHADFHRKKAAFLGGGKGQHEQAKLEVAKAIEAEERIIDRKSWQLKTSRARQHVLEGQYGPAQKLYLEATVEAREELGDHHPAIAQLLSSRATAYVRVADADKRIPLLDESLAIYVAAEAKLGVQLNVMSQKARALGDLGRDEEALPLLKEVLAKRQADPSLRPKLAATHRDLYKVYQRLNNLEKAAEHGASELELTKRRYGERSPRVGRVHRRLGYLALEMSNTELARTRFGLAVEINTAAYGKDHATTITVIGDLGFSEMLDGNFEAALPRLQRVYDVFQTVEGTVPTAKGGTAIKLARCLIGLARYEEAITLLEKGIGLLGKGRTELEVPMARFHLARARYGAGERREGRKMAAAALDEVRGAKRPHPAETARITEWLAAHKR